MPTPGTVVNITTTASANSPQNSLGTAFFIGQTESGPVGTAVAITSLAQYISIFGSRTFNGATPTLYDTVDTFFQEGGSLCYISRVSGASGVTASHVLVDRAGTPLNTLTVSAQGPGTYGNSITVAVANGTPSNSYVLTLVNTATGYTETSPPLFQPSDAVNWAQAYSQLVSIANDGSATAAPNNNPAVIAAVNLSGGVDDTAPADTVWVNALTAFTQTLGPGQVAAPGRITQAVWQGLVEHAQTLNRFALLDGENIATGASIISDAETIQGAVPDPSYGIMLAAYPIYTGLPTGTSTPPYPRVVPPSGPVAGVMAALASAGNNGDVAAAGTNGVLQHATGVTQTYTDAERGLLDAAGVGVIRLRNNQVQLYGYTSLALDLNWQDAGNCRLRMQIVAGVRLIGDGYDFADIDAQGHVASAMGGQIAAFLSVLYSQGALYGVTPADAFSVNVGPSVNTPATAAARQLDADVAVRMSPTAEQVVINVTRVPVTQTLPS